MKQCRVRLVSPTATGGGWFEAPPERTKFHFCQAVCNVPGFPEDLPKKDPFWMDDAMTGSWRYQRRGPNVENPLRRAVAWKGDKEKGIPGMPPSDYFGNKLIPRDEAAKFMPDIHVDGLAEEIAGPLRTMAKHIVPHQFHQFYDESMVVEGTAGLQAGMDKSRNYTWKSNFAMYVNRHPMADEMQRKMLIGDAEAQDKHQDADDVEYEAELVTALRNGDIDTACTIYKKLSDPPRNWHIYTLMVREFISRGLLSDAIAVYDEMEILNIPHDGDFFTALLDCAITASNPIRIVWIIGEARKAPHIPKDTLSRLFSTAIKHLLTADSRHAIRLYRIMKSQNLTAYNATIEKASEILLQAEKLGIVPASDEYVGGHHHRYVYSLTEGGGEEGQGSGGGVAPPVILSQEEIAELESLIAEDEADPQLPYFKKSQPNHVLQPGVVREYHYAQVRGSQASEISYPCRTERTFSASSTAPQMRYTFRWNGPKTRMVSVNTVDNKTVTTEPGVWF